MNASLENKMEEKYAKRVKLMDRISVFWAIGFVALLAVCYLGHVALDCAARNPCEALNPLMAFSVFWGLSLPVFIAFFGPTFFGSPAAKGSWLGL